MTKGDCYEIHLTQLSAMSLSLHSSTTLCGWIGYVVIIVSQEAHYENIRTEMRAALWDADLAVLPNPVPSLRSFGGTAGSQFFINLKNNKKLYLVSF